MSKRYLFIINSKANRKVLNELDDAFARISPEDRVRFEFRYTEYSGHAAEIATEASQQFGSNICIIACGGDGTVHEVVNALAFRNTPMMILPMGTGNDFVRTVNHKKKKLTVYEFLTNIRSYKVRSIDLIRIDSYDAMGDHIPSWSCYCNNVTSVGLDNKVQYDAKRMVDAKPHSMFVKNTAYARAAIKDLFGERAYRFKYSLELENGEIYESEGEKNTLISICNGKYYGGGFCPAPDAELDDGIINVCAIDDVSLTQAVSLLLQYRSGKHIGKEGVKYFRCTSGIITSLDPSYEIEGNYDGENFYGHRIRFEIFPNALKLATIDIKE